MRNSRCGQTLVILVLVIFGGGFIWAGEPAKDQPPVSPPELHASAVLPEAVRAAEAVHVPVEGIQLGAPGSGLQINDEVTLVATVVDEGRTRQWVILLKAQNITAEEKAKYHAAPFTLYSSIGGRSEFPASELGGLAIRILGPYSPGNGNRGAKDVWSGTLINPQFLSIGLAGASTLIQRLARGSQSGSYAINSVPFSPEKIAEGRKATAGLQITPDEERAFAGLMPAMMSFFQIASQTTGLRDIVFEMIDVSWMSLLRHGGKIEDVNFELMPPFAGLESANWGLPSTVRVNTLGMRLDLFKKPALLCRFAVISPLGPMVNCAGIIGFTACRPTGKGPRLILNVVASRLAPPP